MNVINLVKFNNRYIIKEWGDYTEIYDTKKHVLLQLNENGTIDYRDVSDAEIERNVENIDVSDVKFKAITGHSVTIAGDKFLLISMGKGGRSLKEVVEAIKKFKNKKEVE